MKNVGKIKVLHKVSTTGIGGVENAIMNYYRHMNREKFQFDFLTRDPNMADNKTIQELGIEVKLFTATERTDKDLLIKQINSILDDGEYDIVHMNTPYWVGFLIEEIAMLRGISKVIVHSHSSDIDRGKNREEALRIHQYYKEQFSKAYATHFCACSHLAADWLFGPQIPREEISIVKNAIDLPKYTFNKDVRRIVRRELDLDGCFVIGHIGRFCYQKNQEFLINVFAEIHQANTKARLVLIGEGKEKIKLERIVQELNLAKAVLFLGWRDDVEKVLQAMDVFALPSRFEGLPVVLVEAQAAGLKCITSANVTEEVKVTENLLRLPLETDIWCEALLQCQEEYGRKSTYETLTDQGYNIEKEALKLEKLYKI